MLSVVRGQKLASTSMNAGGGCAETSAFLITFILLGKYLEASAKGRTSEAITKLFSRIPPVAILLHKGPDGEILKEEVVESSLVHRGDLLKV